jgi:hypothetical protein
MDGLELKFPGVYQIPRECRKVYVDRVVRLSRRGARNTSDIYVRTNLRSPQWHKTTSTWIITSISVPPQY